LVAHIFGNIIGKNLKKLERVVARRQNINHATILANHQATLKVWRRHLEGILQDTEEEKRNEGANPC
jgi:hypothetical protein